MRTPALVCWFALLAASALAQSAPPKAVRRALLVGCTEYPALKPLYSSGEYERSIRLEGPANDVELFASTLRARLGFAKSDITVLARSPGAVAAPTYANIEKQLAALVEESKAGRLKKGDLVVLYFAGHGVQIPDTNGDEADGLDEVFCPEDIGGWEAKSGVLPNALVDDEIGEKVDAIKANGARVWLLMDSCFSGSGLRGAPELEVWQRGLRGSDLHIPEVDASDLRTRGGRGPERDEPTKRDGLEGGDVIAMFGALSYQRALEMRLPSGSTTRHGLFTWVLCNRLATAAPGATFAELQHSLIIGMQAINAGVLPDSEGELDERVFGEGTREPRMFTSLVGGVLQLDAGRLRSIGPKAVLAVFAPDTDPKPGSELGWIEVVESDLVSSKCRAFEGSIGERKVSGPKSIDVDRLYPTTLAVTPPIDFAMKLAVRDEDESSSAKFELSPADRSFFDERAAQFRFVASGANADLVIWTKAGRATAIEPLGSAASLGRFAVEGDASSERDSLRWAVSNVYEARNLLRLAGDGVLAELPRGLSVTVERRSRGKRPTALESGGRLNPGDEIQIAIQNGSGMDLDVSLLMLDGNYGVTSLFPYDGGASRFFSRESPRIAKTDVKPILSEVIDVDDRSVGNEHLLVIAVPANPKLGGVDFHWLARNSLAKTRGADVGGTQLDLLFRDLANGTSVSRGVSVGEGSIAAASIGSITWETAWNPLDDARRPKSAPQRVLSATNWQRALPPERSTHSDADRANEVVARGAPELDPARALASSVVYVVCRDAKGDLIASGTGFVIGAHRDVVTVAHLASRARGFGPHGFPRVEIRRGVPASDGTIAADETPIAGDVVMCDARSDLALIRLDCNVATLARFEPLAIAERSPATGASCSTVAHPSGSRPWSAFSGRLLDASSAAQSEAEARISKFFGGAPLASAASLIEHAAVRTSIALQPGASGAPLFDDARRVIGVVRVVPENSPSDDGFAIGLDELIRFLAKRPANDDFLCEPPNPRDLDPNLWFASTTGAKQSDLLLAAATADANAPIHEELLDIDENSKLPPRSIVDPEWLAARGFDWEVAVRFEPDATIVYYDRDDDGEPDLVLVDRDSDGVADASFERAGPIWRFDDRVRAPLVSAQYLATLSARIGEKRVREKLAYLTRSE